MDAEAMERGLVELDEILGETPTPTGSRPRSVERTLEAELEGERVPDDALEEFHRESGI